SPQPQIATSWEVSADGLEYTFNIRQGVTFHDGSALTSADVLASIERIREVGAYCARLSDVTELTAPAEYTIKLTLGQPNASLFSAFADPLMAILPAEVVDSPDLTGDQLLGTGPFRFVEWLPDQHVRLARFDAYVQHEGEASGNTGARVAHVE